jgi:hypothetical protein
MRTTRPRAATILQRTAIMAGALLTVPLSADAQQAPPEPRVMMQGAPGAQAPPPQMLVGPQIQRIETAASLSTEPFGAITSVHELPDGRILVNDGTRRRLLLMDTSLTTVRVVLDSLSEIAHSYGTRAGTLLPWRGDSILFLDPAAFALVVLDPNAQMARVRSVWRAQDVNWLTSAAGMYGFPGLDAKGRIVYRVPAQPAPPAVRPPPGVPYFPPQPDSAFIVAVDLDTRRADTLGVIRIPKIEQRVRQMGDNMFVGESVINPLPFTDQWAVLPDGRVAFVRGQDYRIEYLNADGSITSSQKLPYEWQRLADEDKQRLVDSVRTAQQRIVERDYVTAMIRWSNMYGKPYPANFTVPEGYVLPAGMARDWILPPGVSFPQPYIYACGPGEEPPAGMAAMGGMMMAGGMNVMAAAGAGEIRVTGGAPPPDGAIRVTPGAPGAAPGSAPVTPGAPGGVPGAAGAPAATVCLPAPAAASGPAPPPPTPRSFAVVQPDDLPDYRPPLMTGAAGGVRADLDGNLWVRTVLPRAVPGGAVYDIINAEGELVNRFQLPVGYTIVGFGRDRVVYLSMRDPTGLRLARVRLR